MQVTGNKTGRSYSLSIRLRTDGFSFFVNNPSDLAFIQKEDYTVGEGEEYANRLQQALQNSSLCSKSNAGVYVLTTMPDTRVPLEHFKKDEAEALFRLTFSQADPHKHRIVYNILPSLEVVELSAIDKDVERVLQERYPIGLQFLGTEGVMLEALQTYNEQQNAKNSRLYVYFHDGEMFLFRFQEGKLNFANSYAVAGQQDAVYYLLYAWKLMELNASADECLLVGTSPFIGLLPTLRTYLRQVKEITPRHLFPNLPQTAISQIPFDIFILLSSKNKL